MVRIVWTNIVGVGHGQEKVSSRRRTEEEVLSNRRTAKQELSSRRRTDKQKVSNSMRTEKEELCRRRRTIYNLRRTLKVSSLREAI